MDVNGNSEAGIGAGSEFWLADGQGALVELDEVTDIPFAEDMADDVEVTHYKSPGKRKEYKRGLIEPGEGTLTLNYLPGSATDQLIREAQQSGGVRAYRAIVPDGTGELAWQIDGFVIVRSRSRAVPIGDRMTCSVGIRFTGAVDEAAYTAGGA